MAEFADASPHGLELALFLRSRRVEVEDGKSAVAGFLVAMHSAQGAGRCFHRIGCAEHTRRDAMTQQLLQMVEHMRSWPLRRSV